MPMHPCEFDTIAVMPAAAFTHAAGSGQRERGVSYLSSPLGLCVGSQPHHRLGQHRLSTRAVPGTPWLRSLCPHGHNPLVSPGPGSCSCAAPVLRKALTGAAPT